MGQFVLLLCLSISVVLANGVNTRLDPTDGSSLTKPLIVDPNAPSEAQQQNIADIAKVFASEPESATQETPNADEADSIVSLIGAGTGGDAAAGGAEGEAAEGGEAAAGEESDSSEDTSEDPAASKENQSAIEKEIKLLTSLVEHGKAIAAALPDKEKRLKELAAQLAAAKGQEMAQGAQAKLAEQQLLLSEIKLKIAALKKKLEELETTQTKLEASIAKVQSAVDSNAEVTHELNQEAAVASVGGDLTGAAAVEAATGETAAAAPTPATLLEDKSINAASKAARDILKRFSKLVR